MHTIPPSSLFLLGLLAAAGIPGPEASADSESAAPPSSFLAEALGAAVLAHHGPGTSGGGSTTISGETLKQGSWDLDLRTDYTQFRHFSREQAEEHAARSGEFDAVDRSLVESLSLAYGLTDDLQLAAQVGYYHAENFISAERGDDGTVDSGAADPAGFTDLWITGKYRFLRGPIGNIAFVGGVKLPTGTDGRRLDNGELLEPSSQPGSGAVDFQAGLGYSRFLTAQLTIDASVLYTLRTRRDDFKVGDRLDLGAALAYRLTDDIDSFPQWSIFGELNAVIGWKDEPAEGPNPNTGGTTLFLTPGVRIRFTPHAALTVAPSFPVYQNLNGDQDKTEFKLAATLSFSF